MAGPNNNISPEDRIIPAPGVYDFTSVEIHINGSKIDNPAYQLISVLLISEVNVIPSVRIIYQDGDVAEEKFGISESADFIPGNKIELKVGRDGQIKSLFNGIIVKHSIRANDRGGSYLQIDGKDEAVKLTLGRRNKYFENVKDSDAIKTVLGDKAGTIDATTVTHKELVQYYCTDWDFALSRAEMNSRLLLVEKGKVNVVKPILENQPSLVLIYGATIYEFEAVMDSRTQWQEVSASSWNYAGQALLKAQTSGSPFPEAGNLQGSRLAAGVAPSSLQLRHSGLVTEPELKAWVDSFLLKSRMAKIRGRVKITGSPAAKPGDTIELKGLGNRFNGLVYVSGVQHELHEGIWTTQLQFGLTPEWFYHKEEITETPAAGLLPAVHGLQIGIVVQLENDPDGEHRILVKLPLVDNDAKGTWARMASLDAGANRGYFFRPEIGDEVIVGFVNDDPRFAVVLGMLHSSANPAPMTAEDTNHKKGLVTRSKMKTVYDDENKVISIETPAGNKLELSEKDKAITVTDQNGNSLKMEASGITMKSAADIKIEATGSFSMKAGTDMKIEGLSISEKASTTMEISGQASTKLSSSGILEVQGSMVKIN